MPMGFCAILGGTITMVGSSPLILLNDLILTSNKALPAAQQMETWSMFSVTPIGIALLATGIIYFVLAGRYVLPGNNNKGVSNVTGTKEYFQKLYGMEHDLFEVAVPAGSPLIGKNIGDLENEAQVRVIAALQASNVMRIGAGRMSREIIIEADSVLGLMCTNVSVREFVEANGLKLRRNPEVFAESLATSKAGVAELIIPPNSSLIGKSAREVWMRKVYGLTLLAMHRQVTTLREYNDIVDMPFQAGDALVVHTTWATLAHLEKDSNFIVVTTEYPHEELRPNKVAPALVFFGVAMALIMFTEVRLSIALLTGAIGMILSGVIKIEEAYQAVSWKSVFLLSSLIPLGLAVGTTGTAAWIAEQTLSVLGGVPIWALQLAITVLATAFTLVMSNVGATVLLVPVAVNIAIGAGANPAVFALTVALATSNSFFLPTHQVNALIMGPAGYRVSDFMRAGGIMSILFLGVMMIMLNLIF